MNSQILTFNSVGDKVPPPGSVLRSPGSWRLGKLADNLFPHDVFLLILLTQLINTSLYQGYSFPVALGRLANNLFYNDISFRSFLACLYIITVLQDPIYISNRVQYYSPSG